MNATDYPIGSRVQLHAACSEWMQGDRYGIVVGYGKKRAYRIAFESKETALVQPVRVKLDSGRIRRFHPDNLFPV